jgi:serine/threonine-protein kinase SRPK3
MSDDENSLEYTSSYSSDSDSDDNSESSNYSNDEITTNLFGHVINGRYILIKELGKGGFSVVYLAYYINDPSKKFYYAIKCQNSSDYKEGIKEVQILQKIKNINSHFLLELIDYYEYKIDPEKDPIICMVFDIMASSVYQVFRRGKYRHGMPPNIILDITKQVLIGLNEMHNKLNIIHSDIKPENVLIKGKETKTQDLINKLEGFKISDLYNKLYLEQKKNSVLSLKNDKNLKQLKLNARAILKTKLKEIMQLIDDKQESNTETSTSDISKSDDNNIEVKQVSLDNIHVVIADFGTVYSKNELSKDLPIQTRYYRAPEIILQCYCDDKCDVWSLGCMLYEMLTGEILFDPSKDKKRSRDYHHIYWIYEIIGEIPNWMKHKSDIRDEFFNKDGSLLTKAPERWTIRDILIEKNVDMTNPLINKIVLLIENMLIIDPKKRPSIQDLICIF